MQALRCRFQLIVIFFLGLLGGCGAAATPVATLLPTSIPTDAPRPTAVPKPTDAPKPTAAPQPTAAAVLPGLGLTRAAAQAKFEVAPFNFAFKDDPTVAQGPAVRGSASAKGPEVILRGPAENIVEAEVSAILDDQHASADEALRAMIALLEVAAPAIDQPIIWLRPHLDAAFKTGTDTAIEGDRKIVLIAEPTNKILIMGISPTVPK